MGSVGAHAIVRELEVSECGVAIRKADIQLLLLCLA
jgi:hypothetical protein